MSLFRWTSQHAVYLPEIDAEHRGIFTTAAELERASATRAPRPKILQSLRALLEQAEDHFSHEERLMRAIRYDAFDWHKKQHDGVRRSLKLFAKRIEAGDAKAAAELLVYLAHWLHDHTALTDRMMGARLRNYDRQHTSAR